MGRELSSPDSNPSADNRSLTDRTPGTVVPDSLGPAGRGTRPPRRGRYAHRDLTSGSIPRNLWFLAWPQTVSGSLMVVDRLWDLFLAGFIGYRAIAGIGVAQTWSMLLFTARMGLDISMRAMVSRAVGAGNIQLANHVVLQAFTIGIVGSLIIAAPAIVLTESLMRLLGVSDEIVAIAAAYMRIQFIATVAQGMMMMSGAALQAAGDPITPMHAQVLSRILHFALSPLLIFGWFWFPDMGIAGAALAMFISGLIGLSWNLWALFRGTSRLHLTLRGYRLDPVLMWRIVRIGAPASVSSMERSFSQLAIVWLVTGFGDVTLAAYSVAQRVQMLTNLGSMGLGQGAGIMVGQNLGAGKPEQARKVVGWALVYVLMLSITITLVLLVFAEPFLTIFIRDPAVMEVAVPWLRIVVLGFMVMGVGMVFMQSYNTAGDTLVPMVVSLITIWGVQVPLAIMLSGVVQDWTIFGLAITLPTIADLGQYGIAWSMVIAMASRLFFYVPYFFTDRWLRKQVFAGMPMRGAE